MIAALYGASFPLIAIYIEASGASNRLIGFIAAMPAAGWILGTVALPRLLQTFQIKSVMTGLLGLACLAWALSTWITTPYAWAPMRLVFGGALGVFFRAFEYWLTTQAPAAHRGRTLGIYAAVFVGGIITGALIQPLLGAGYAAQVSIGAGLLAVAVFFALFASMSVPRPTHGFRPTDIVRFGKIAPLAMLAAVVFAFYEEIPASFLPIYALKIGYAETFAAIILAVSAFGSLTGAIPMGWLSDKIGRTRVLILGAGAGTLGAILIPLFAGSQITLLSGIFVWGILVEGIFCVSLAIMADRFAGEDLLHVNMSYGIYYALGALLGPLLTGEFMHLFGPNGLFIAAGSVFAALFIIAIWNDYTHERS